MPRKSKLERLIDDTLAAVKGKGAEAERLRAFIAELFIGGSPEDIAAHPPKQLAAMARAAFGLFAQHRPGRFRLVLEEIDGLPDSSFVLIVNDDMPFLVDSVLGLLNETDHVPRLVLHPLYAVHRETDGTLLEVAAGSGRVAPGMVRESFMLLELDRITDETDREALTDEISSVLSDVRTVVLDWEPMMKRLNAVIEDFKERPPPVPVDELAESIQFLEWLVDHNFTFLGLREYGFEGSPDKAELMAVEGSGLGILRDPDVHVLRRGKQMVAITPEVREFLMQPAPLIITKANVRATVHRRAHMDYIGVKNFAADGRLQGELRVVGLFTSSAYNQSPRRIPLLRRKIATVIQESEVPPESHSGKTLLNVLETYPRDELFQVDVATLHEIAEGIRQLGERPRTRLFVRRDKFDRFVSCLVYVPRDQYNTDVRMRIGALLAGVFEGRVSAYYPDYPEGPLARVHIIIGRDEGKTPEPDLVELEGQIAELALAWDDRLERALERAYDLARSNALTKRYAGAFSAAYQEAFEADEAISDIEHMERLSGAGDIEIEFYRLKGAGAHDLGLKIFHLGGPIALSDRLPILEAMGLRAVSERSYWAEPRGGEAQAGVWLHDIALAAADALEAKAFDRLKALLEECFLAVWGRRAENDGYNALVLRAGMPWQEVAVLRGYSKYLRQAGAPFSQRYLAQTLSKHAHIAGFLRDLFRIRFDPASGKSAEARRKGEDGIIQEIERALADVSSLDEDRIVRRFLNVILATLRANAFQDGEAGLGAGPLAFKISSRMVEALPEPRPYAEIFVYSPGVEGVHLRGGKIARGGLRWSDRPEDFRTEVLGLAKAQQVKNAVIVPVGAKGGFVPKRLPAGGSREEIQEEAVRCYKTFVSSLLDITDNIVAKKTVPPDNVVRYDEDDPYLVVAADKGTATFSDIANEISEEHGFWLGDAFASGGSAGYDHKKMGITARGGWEAVKRHFREMDIDIQLTPFTVIGVGDMSGDVFGNGMLLSRHIRLLAAFDHRDIFIDPDPDPAGSYAERARLFKMGRSSWQDYSAKLISKGGGVFSRAAKSIPLSDEIRRLTGLKGANATPQELMRALLAAQADLLWFGGIGTYVRASDESNEDAGDRANDAIRIPASQLRVKVVGEGANLGLTQRARIEFALSGGRINTDAIDNSAGVNSSDLEVNIKIALGAVEAAGKLTRPARNKLLAEMTDEVAALVLRNNYRQTLAISVAEARGLDELGFQARLMRNLERRGLLDRELEDLPDDLAVAEREAEGKALSRPEIAVLLAYAKIVLYDELLGAETPDDPYLAGELKRYFPAHLVKRHAKAIEQHPLRREIIATMLANSMINRGGPSFVSRLADETGAGPASIAAAFVLARESFDLLAVNDEIDKLDNKISGEAQLELYLRLQELLRSKTTWFIANVLPVKALEKVIARYREGVETLRADLGRILPDDSKAALEAAAAGQREKGVPAGLAKRIAELDFLAYAPDIIMVAERVKRPIKEVAQAYFMIGSRLRVYELAHDAQAIPAAEYFDRLAINRATDGLFESQRGLAADALNGRGAAQQMLEGWLDANAVHIERTEQKIGELLSTGELNLAKLTVANSYLRDLLQA